MTMPGSAVLVQAICRPLMTTQSVRLGFRVARSPFSGGSTMARHLFFAITLIGTGVLLNSPAEAVSAALM
jgi:hypothetical protein